VTWIPCHRCHQIPCVCVWSPFAPNPICPKTQPEVGSVTWTPSPEVPKLSDADIERIAQRVVEKLAERKPETRRARAVRLKQRAANRSRP